MFNKVIISEDFDSINLAVVEALKDCAIREVDYTKYCDDALLKIKKAILDDTPYDLLLTDLSFKEDHRDDTITLKSGDELIAAVRALQPNIKIIVYSIEDKSYRIKSLFENYHIDGYVMKGRNSIPELKNALTLVYNTDQRYLSPTITHVLQDKTVNEIDNYDLELLKYLSIGIPQEQMENQFKMLNISPNSKSSIEKRINKLKTYFKASNTIHLIAIAKDLGLI
ncbi:response regulator [Flavobacterium sp. NG2]|uniref:response regulator n=1 Tax=Flavobacterium sp. NG2 TaxID=3097547 RepID=UPI002A81917C|nr:response regulator [Flavobacterium sp. NG2]WPR71328.1 response regulator [Flavobacterium sp. NG2]